MKRVQRLTPNEYEEFKELLPENSVEQLAEELLEKMSSYLFGILLDYGVNDTEVRDWVYTQVMKRKDGQSEI